MHREASLILSPIGVYRLGVKAVPALKYALGVAGVIAAGVIALSVAKNNIITAIQLFLFVFVGALLVLMLAHAAARRGVVTGPASLILWGIAVLFLVAIMACMSAVGFGWPPLLAELLNVVPRNIQQQASNNVTTAPQPSAPPPSPSTTGEEGADDGEIITERNVNIGYLPQESSPAGNETVIEIATAISPEAMNAAMRVRKPTVIRTPSTIFDAESTAVMITEFRK